MHIDRVAIASFWYRSPAFVGPLPAPAAPAPNFGAVVTAKGKFCTSLEQIDVAQRLRNIKGFDLLSYIRRHT
jgi:hypothetical protein